jgi:hypothetical protein
MKHWRICTGATRRTPLLATIRRRRWYWDKLAFLRQQGLPLPKELSGAVVPLGSRRVTQGRHRPRGGAAYPSRSRSACTFDRGLANPATPTARAA